MESHFNVVAVSEELAHAIGDFEHCDRNEFIDLRPCQATAAIHVVPQRPFDDIDGSDNGVIEEFVDDVDGSSRVVRPELENGIDDLAARLLRLWTDGEETLLAAVDGGENVAERFASNGQDGSHVDVGATNERVFDPNITRLVVNGVENLLDVFLRRLPFEQAQYFAAFFGKRGLFICELEVGDVFLLARWNKRAEVFWKRLADAFGEG